MAETRKHRITIRDELDAQLIAQMGEEPVRPYEAGAFHRKDSAADADATPSDAPAKPTTLGGIPGTPLTAYSFGVTRRPPTGD